ncbi:MAG: hypothetical protein JST96_07670, partial [Bacteroidetes bacterium]|nr:hypothetical protein [Bacteroidota bacterium]
MKNCVFIPLAIFCCQATFSQSSDSSQAYYQKGITEKNARRFMVAYKNFQKSVEFKKDNVDAQTQLGLTALELRDYGNAEVAFLKVNELKKDDPVAIENLANIYFWTHQWKQAIEFGEKAKQLNVGKNWNY